MSLDRFDLE